MDRNWAILGLVLCIVGSVLTQGAPPAYGQDMRSEFFFSPGLIFLNHGSFGATPKSILYKEFEYQIEMERDTMNWMNRERVPLLNECRNQIAAYSGAKTEDVVMVLDATSGINAVFRSLQLREGDKILYLDTAYGAVQELFRVMQWAVNLELVEVQVPFPLSSPQDVVNVVAQAFQQHGSSITVALFSHITSPTAIILPIKELTDLAHSYGTKVFIDGAHSLGQIPVNITDIGADYYTSDIHKWLCGPKGAGILWVRDIYRDSIVPTSISSGASGGYIAAFEWTGTLDFSAYLSTMSALSWRQYIGGDEKVNSYMTSLCAWAGQSVSAVWGTTYPAIAPQSMFASLSVAQLPPNTIDLAVLQEALYQDYQIEVVLFSLSTGQYTRMSCHVYNYEEEYLIFAEALLQLTTQGIISDPNSTEHERFTARQRIESGLQMLQQLRESLTNKV